MLISTSRFRDLRDQCLHAEPVCLIYLLVKSQIESLRYNECSLIEPMDTPQANIARADKLIKKGSNVFKVNREHDDGIVREVCCASLLASLAEL